MADVFAAHQRRKQLNVDMTNTAPPILTVTSSVPDFKN